ncbi:MAG: response regulator [Bauldia sp.]|nr:response regulator [Bauldia sp.]MCW5719117.1 response regulator [Bauldia sp.]
MRSTVLVVDDDASAAEELGDMVSLAGWNAESATGADEALERLAARHDVGVVITDLFMTGASGFDLIQRSRRTLAEPPAFVIVTAHPAYDLAVRAIQNEVVDFVEKPVSGPALRAALGRAAASGHLQSPANGGMGALRDVAGRTVADFIRLREHVRRTLTEELSVDPCLDILLHAADAEYKGKVLSVSSACSASGVPTTTALRRIADLEEAGLIQREASSTDRRLSLLSLTETGRSRIADIARRYGSRSTIAGSFHPGVTFRAPQGLA